MLDRADSEVGPGGEWVPSAPPVSLAVGPVEPLMTLPDGTVLLITGPIQRYHPDTRGWTPAGSLLGNVEIGGLTTLLNGKVLVTGLSPAEVYDAVTATSTLTGAMIIPRSGHQATRLPSGDVLVSGGTDANGQLVGRAELYHPSSGVWTLTGVLNGSRTGHIAILLPTGKVLVVGGYGQNNVHHNSAQLYDPTSGTWTPASASDTPVSAGVLLQNGQALVIGASNPQGFSSQLYDSATGVWAPSVALPVIPFFGGSLFLGVLNDERALFVVASHDGTCGLYTYLAWLFDPKTGMWAPASNPPASNYGYPGMTMLLDGRALLIQLAPESGLCFGPSAAQLFRPDNSTPRLALTPPTVDSGTVAIGSSIQQTITVQNTGQAQLTGSASLSGGSSPPFQLLNSPAFSVGPGATWDVLVGFTASDFGSFSGSVSFMSNGGWASPALKANVGVQLSGNLTGADGLGVASIPVELHGASSASTTSDANGHYSFFVPPNGGYTVIPASPTLTFSPSSRSVSVDTSNIGGLDFVVTTVAGTVLQAAVLPSSRSMQFGVPATAFATLINASPAAATGCGISPITSVPATFRYQTTEPSTNAVTGTPNTPVIIPAGVAQSYVLAFTPTGPFSPIDVQLSFDCTNTNPAPVTSGVNTLLLTASSSPVPDVVALAATMTSDGIVNIPGAAGTGVFAIATVNVGAGGIIIASADTGATALPLNILLCQTNPATGVCLAAPTSSVATQMSTNDTSTFEVFVTGTATVPLDPGNNRIFVRFKDLAGVTRGATSVAVWTR